MKVDRRLLGVILAILVTASAVAVAQSKQRLSEVKVTSSQNSHQQMLWRTVRNVVDFILRSFVLEFTRFGSTTEGAFLHLRRC